MSAVTLNLKTPQSQIQQTVDILLLKESDPKKKQHLTMISHSNRSLLNEVSSYADYLLIKRGQFKEHITTFDIRATVKSSIDIYKLQAEAKKIEIEALNDLGMPRLIKADKARL